MTDSSHEIAPSSSETGLPQAEQVVTVTDLTKNFGGRCAVDNISFAIKPGECLGFLGPNGAGKTTTINILLGLVRKTSGRISLLGQEIPKYHRQVKRWTGVVPQADSLDPDLSVAENLLTYAGYFNIPRKKALGKTEELLHFFALHNRQNEIIEHLSGGQRRRLLLARALINEPLLLILDEPTIGLDPQARHLIWERLEILRDQGTTMLLTSHYLDEVSRLSNRILILDQGKIVAQGKPRQLVKDMVGLEVFEVEGSSAELDEMAKCFAECDALIERANDKLYIYTREECSHLEKILANTRSWLRRPANLEDLFIQLTGRSLRES